MKKVQLFLNIILLINSTSLFANNRKDDDDLCWNGEKENGQKTGEWIATDCKTGIKKISTFYLAGKKDGTETHYQQNGKPQSIYTYSKGKINGLVVHFTPLNADTLGVINYVNNVPEGEWRLFNWKKKQIATITIKKGKIETSSPLMKFTNIKPPPSDYRRYFNDSQKYIGIYYMNQQAFADFNKTKNSGDSVQVYSTNEAKDSGAELPVFRGGQSEMMALIQNNLVYPLSARETGRQGTIYISFIINEDGSISNEEVISTSSALEKKAPDLAGESLRIVSLFPPFTPAVLNGKPIKVKMILPIRYVLK
ncbi:MAG: energy transducer TonB [Bacteroidetes bacterium]|nr:energy transducer TonB [Bacteroidota bacterium]